MDNHFSQDPCWIKTWNLFLYNDFALQIGSTIQIVKMDPTEVNNRIFWRLYNLGNISKSVMDQQTKFDHTESLASYSFNGSNLAIGAHIIQKIRKKVD